MRNVREADLSNPVRTMLGNHINRDLYCREAEMLARNRLQRNLNSNTFALFTSSMCTEKQEFSFERKKALLCFVTSSVIFKEMSGWVGANQLPQVKVLLFLLF